MIIDYHKHFSKKYQKLPLVLQKKVDAALERFEQNPFDPQLKNHALKGLMKDKRPISVTGDVRIIFKEYDKYAVILVLDVGSHPKVYSS